MLGKLACGCVDGPWGEVGDIYFVSFLLPPRIFNNLHLILQLCCKELRKELILRLDLYLGVSISLQKAKEPLGHSAACYLLLMTPPLLSLGQFSSLNIAVRTHTHTHAFTHPALAQRTRYKF